MNRLLAIVGPTATGKTNLSLRLAKMLPVEIVNGDSRQVYRGMDIGTGKPAREQRALVQHHLFDVVDPDEEFHVAIYKRLATAAIGQIQKRGRLPVLVGGSGQYVWSVVEGWTVPEVAPDPSLRRNLETEARMQGDALLHLRLAQIDPEAAARIQPSNVRRVIRALEIYYHSRQKPSDVLWRKRCPQWQVLMVGLTLRRADLYERIDRRIDRMIAEGLVDEVKWLVGQGYQLDLPSLSSIGYREIGRYLQGEVTLDQAVKSAKMNTHRMARHQYSWFRLGDPRIHWFCAADPGDLERALRVCTDFVHDSSAVQSRANKKGDTPA